MFVRAMLVDGFYGGSKNVGATWDRFSIMADANTLGGLIRSKFWLRLIGTVIVNGACIGVLWLNGYQWTAIVYALATVVVIGFQLVMPRRIKRYLAAAAAVYAREFNIVTPAPDEPEIDPSQINPDHPRPVLK